MNLNQTLTYCTTMTKVIAAIGPNLTKCIALLLLNLTIMLSLHTCWYHKLMAMPALTLVLTVVALTDTNLLVLLITP